MSRWILALSLLCGPLALAQDPSTTPPPTQPAAPAPAPQPVAAAPAQSGPVGAVNEAKRLLEDGTPQSAQAALAILQPIVASQPDMMHARYNLAVALHQSGDAAGAEREIQNILQKDPGFGPAWAAMGVIQLSRGQTAQAEETLRTGITKAPEEMTIRVALIDLLRSQRRTQDAINAAKDALKVDTRAVEVFNSLGLAYLDQNELMLARFVYQKALRDGDGDGRSDIPGADQSAYIHCNLGWTWFLQGDPFAAEAELKKAIELDPNLVPALVYLSRLYMDARNYADTVPLLERAAARAPRNHGVQMNLGLAYRGVGRLPDARAAYQRALEIDPRNPDPHFNLGVLTGDYEKNYPGAIAEFQQYLQLGGKEAALANEYIEAIQREQKQQEKRKKAEEDKKRREEERKKRDQAEKAAPAPAPDGAAPAGGTPDGGAPAPGGEAPPGGTGEAPAPAPTDAPAPAPTDAPAPAPTDAPAPAPAPAPGTPADPWGGPK